MSRILKRASNTAQLPTKPDQLLLRLEDWRENQNLVFNSAKTEEKTKYRNQN